MLNEQPVEPVLEQEPVEVQFHSIWKTMQGEGPFAGVPAIFIRLAGCNLRCPFCDTDYTSKREPMRPDEVLIWVHQLTMKTRIRLVVLTGGEPMRQAIGPTVDTLLDAGYRVQIETNGTIFRPELNYSSKQLFIVCSPKTAKINERLIPYIDALKYVVSWDAYGEDGLPTELVGRRIDPTLDLLDLNFRTSKGEYCPPIYIQPLDTGDDELNKKNVDAAVEICMEHGYTLCLQTHKMIGLD